MIISLRKLYRTLLNVCIIGLIFTPPCFSHPYGHPTSWRNPKILEQLSTAPITHIEPMETHLKRQGKTDIETFNEIQLITLTNDIRAVFKSSKKPFENEAEVAAYELSRFLGFPAIPPTCMRTIKGKTGSLQLYVDSPLDMTNPETYKQVLNRISPTDLDNLKLFYFLLGHWDGNPKNLLAYQCRHKTYLISIDHAKTHHTQYFRPDDMPFVKLADTPKLKQSYTPNFPFNRALDCSFNALIEKFEAHLPANIDDKFMFSPDPTRFILAKGAIWYQKNDIQTCDIIRPAIAPYTPFALKAIQRLDRKVLYKIFSWHKNKVEYVDAILNRRDQILNTGVNFD